MIRWKMKHIAVLGLATLVKGDCETLEGTQLTAPAFVCNQLDNTLRRDYQIKCKKWKNAWGDKPECCDACQADFKTCYDECKDQIELSPPELNSFSCDPLPELEHGNIYCTKGQLTGTICLGTCQQGFTLAPRVKKRCKARANWNKNVPGKAPNRWNQADNHWACEKEWVQSPCATNNGGCSHECLDRGDGNHKCICPCGQILGADGKTCSINADVCPFDIKFFVDQTSNTCDDETYQNAQLSDVGTIVKFFNQELLANGAKLGLGFWNDEKVNKIVTKLRDNMKMEKILEGLIEEYNELQCQAPTLGEGLFLPPQFEENNRDESVDVSSVTFVTMAGAVNDDNSLILANRPQADNVIVLTNKDNTDETYQTQAKLLGCGNADEECPNVLKISETAAVDIEQLVSRSQCYNRVYSSSISCTEFYMELRVPKCALKGLELSDVMFNDVDNCALSANEDGNHFVWQIDYNDCGTTKSLNSSLGVNDWPRSLSGEVNPSSVTAETGIISYANRLKTKLDLTGSVEPIMPLFDVPLQCDMHTSYDFVFAGAWHPDISSFSADLEAHYDLTGTMALYHDQDFDDAFDGETAIPNGKAIFVQSEIALPEEYAATGVRLHSCISSPGALDNMQPVEANNPFWMLIDNGCINDSTVNILERGPDGQIRFSFEGFTFHNFADTEIQIQCEFKTCLDGDDCSDALPMCENRR